MADVNLTGDARSLVGALEQASAAFIEFGTATARITQDVAKLDKDGNILSRTITAIDESGQKLSGTVQLTADGIAELAGVTAAAVRNLETLATTTTAAAEAQALLAEATALGVDALITETNVLRKASEAATVDAAAARAAAEAHLANADAAQTEAGAQSSQERAARKSVLATNLDQQATELDTLAHRAFTAAIEAETAALQLRARAELVTEQGQRAVVLSGLNEEQAREAGKLEAKTRAEAKAFREKQAAEFEKFEATERASNKRTNDEFIAGEQKKTRAASTEAKKRAAEFEKFESLERASNDKANADFLAREAKKTADLLAESKKRQLAVQAENLQTRRPATDFRTVGEGGIASKQQVKAFLQAEVAVKKLVTTTKVGAKEMQVAIAKASTGALQLAGNLSVAERAALKLFLAEELVAKGAAAAATSAQNLGSSFKSLANLIGISLLIGAAFKLVTAFSEALEVAGELSIKIAEIETITKKSAFTTENWASGLRDLSSAFGLDILDQAEAAYQVLSNQIRNASGAAIQGAEALKFLDAANKLAITGVTDTASATNLLTAALNSFRIPAEEAEVVAAQLFKTVELGRLRIEELAQSFGRIAVPANQLGIELEELLGAIAQVTIQGVKFNEASTLIRGVILKLLRPTDSLKETFQELGVASGEALIGQRGFIGALEAIEDSVGGTSTALGKAFGRIRAITGALIFAGKGVDEAAASIEEIRNTSIASFGEDTQKIIQTTGQQLKIAGEEAKNFFERTLGTPALDAVAGIIKRLGGMENILTIVINTLEQLGNVAIAVILGSIIPAVNSLGASVKALSVFLAANPLTAGLTVASLLVLAVTDQIEASVAAGARAAEKANLAILKSQEASALRASALLASQTKQITSELRKRTQILLQELGRRRAALTDQGETEVDNQKDITRRLKVATSEFAAGLTKVVQESSRLFKAAEKDAETAGKKIGETFARFEKQNIEIDLLGAGFGQQAEILGDQITQLRAKAALEVEEGNLKNFELESKRIRELSKQAIDAAISRSRIEIRLGREALEARVRLSRAFGRQARENAQQQLTDIERRQKLLANGTTAQLEAETRLQATRAQFDAARSEEDFRAAFKAFNDIRREQELIEASVKREKELKAEAAKDEKIRLGQLKEIRQTREAEQRIAQQQQNRLKIIQFLFAAITKDAEAFNQEQTFELKNKQELLTSVAEQQERLGKIIALQREIGGGAEAEALIRAKSASLQRATDLELAKRANDRNQLLITSEQKLFKLRISAAQDIRNANVQALDGFSESLKNIQSVINDFETGTGSPVTGLAGQISEDATRLQELAKVLRDTPELFTNTLQKEMQDLFEEFKKNLVLANERARQPLATALPRGRTGLAEIQRISQERAVQQRERSLFESLGQIGQVSPGTPLGEVGNVIERDRAQVAQLQLLREQSAQLDSFLIAKDREQTAVVDASDALKTFTGLTESAAASLTRIGKAARGEEQFPTVPQAASPLVPANLENLTRDTKDAFIQGAKDAESEVANSAARATTEGATRAAQSAAATEESRIKSLAQIRAEETVKTEEVERLKSVTRTADQLAGIKASAERRAEAALQLKAQPPEFKSQEVDTSIILGRGAPSIAEQQTRIAKELAEQAAAKLAFEKVELENKKEQAAIARQRAIDEGRLGVNRAGQLVGRRGRAGGLQEDVDTVDPIIDPEAPSAANTAVLRAIKAENDRRAALARGPIQDPGALTALEGPPLGDFGRDEASTVAAAREAHVEALDRITEVELEGVPAQERLNAALEARADAFSILQAQQRGGIETTDAREAFQRTQDEVRSAEKETAPAASRILEARIDSLFARIDLTSALKEQAEAVRRATRIEEDQITRAARVRAFQAAQFTQGLSEEQAARIGSPTTGAERVASQETAAQRASRFAAGSLGITQGTGKADATITTDMVKATQALREVAEEGKSEARIRADRQLRQEAALAGGIVNERNLLDDQFDERTESFFADLDAQFAAINKQIAAADLEGALENEARREITAGSEEPGSLANLVGGKGFVNLFADLFDAGPPTAQEQAAQVLAEAAREAAEALAARTESDLQSEAIESVVPDLDVGTAGENARQQAIIAEGAFAPTQLESAEAFKQTAQTTSILNGTLLDVNAQLREFAEALLRFNIPSTPPPEDFGARIGLGFADGGPVAGPGGVDNVPAMLTSGEFVVRRQQAQKFFPQLLAMNAGRLQPPQRFQDGGPVDVGGINVTVNESSSPQATMRQVVSGINRGIRTGTIKLRR